LFSGFFGVGKTTAISSLLSRKSKNENWAILVNEFGEVAIDHTVLNRADEDNVTIREIPGGCMCCAMNIPMRSAITEILRRVRPDRLLIEPTGIGHPSGILDELQSPDLQDIIDIGAVICFLDPRFVGDSRIEQVEIFRDQIQLADVLIATKTDLASKEDMERYYSWAEGLFPEKYFIGETLFGNIDESFLDILPHKRRLPLFPNLHIHEKQATLYKSVDPRPGTVVRLENRGAGYQGCGWIFAGKDQFDEDALIDYLGPPGPEGLENIERLKGVFRVGPGWVLIDRVRDELSILPTEYNQDSRVEMILSDNTPVDWLAIEAILSKCIKKI
jgi:G3E family GTPase